MKEIKPILLVIVALVTGGLGFFGGLQYQKSKTPTQFGFNRNGAMGNRGSGSGQGRSGGFGGAQAGLRPISGKVISVDDKSVTVEQNDGSSKIVLFSSAMTLSKAAEATKTDLVVGSTVRIFGIANSDGSMTAQNIQLNPAVGMPSGSASQ